MFTIRHDSRSLPIRLPEDPREGFLKKRNSGGKCRAVLGLDRLGRPSQRNPGEPRRPSPYDLNRYFARFSMGTNSRVSGPIQTCRGRAIFCSGSISISCHCDSQPMVRGIANSTVNISGLKPIAW